MNALIAEKVMGYQSTEGCDGQAWFHPKEWKEGIRPIYYHPRPYSTDISVAWEVVKKMINDGFDDFGLSFSNCWHASFGDYEEVNQSADEETAPLAICVAALRTVDK